MGGAAFHIAPVQTPCDLEAVKELFRAYAASLEIDLAYQGFEAELAAMPGKYAAPSGVLLLARNAKETASLGCIALRPLDRPGCCEMKRLYVAPKGRGLGLGKALVEALVARAEEIGYQEMLLDTLPSMTGALSIYHGMGFEMTSPYYDTPVSGTIFMRRKLSASHP